MGKLIYHTRFFLLPYLIVFLSGVTFLLIYSKADIHIFINRNHHPALDSFFVFYTNAGHGFFAVLIIIILFFIKYRYSFALLSTYATSGLIVQLMKQGLLEDMQRPVNFFQGIYELYLVKGIDYHYYQSFPSGHTSTAFGVFLTLALTIQNKYIQFLCFILALLVGYSRIYLSMHFLNDVVFGSLIGTIASLACFYLFGRIRKKWMDQSLTGLFKQKHR